MAFVVVQGANSLQTAPAGAVMKEELTVGQSANTRSPPSAQPVLETSELATMLPVLLGPLVLAVFCYLLLRRAI